MTNIFSYLSATKRHSVASLVVKMIAFTVLLLQSLILLSGSAQAQAGRSLFKMEKANGAPDHDGRESTTRFTFHKTGLQRSCDYVSYKIRFNLTHTPGSVPDTAFINTVRDVRLNFRDQLPPGLRVIQAKIVGDLIGAPAIAIGTVANPNDTVSIPGIRLDSTIFEAGGTHLSFEVSINARIDPAAFAVPTTIDNQATLSIDLGAAGTSSVSSHDPAKPDTGDELTGVPTSVRVDLTDCDRTPPGGGDTPEEACFELIEGEIDCNEDGDGTFTYRLPMGPEMAGRSIELVPLTPGITVDPESQVVPVGGGVLEWTIFGAVPGSSLTFSVVGTEISAGPAEGWGLCCAQIIEIIIPEDIDCPDPEKEPDLEVKKQALVSECRIGSGCKFRITVTNVGDAPYTGPIALDEVVTEGPAILVGPPNAPWTCVPNSTPMTCKHPATTLNPGESVVLNVSLRHLTRRKWNWITNCAELDYTASGWPAPFGDLTNDKSCARVPIKYPPNEQDPKKADLQLQKRANDTKCSPNGFCHFTIVITNVGSSDYNGTLRIDDTYPSGAPLASSFAPSPPWACIDGAPGSYSCGTAGNVNLPIGASMSISVKTQIGMTSYPSKQVENCAELRPINLETNLANNRACATQAVPGRENKKPDLKIEKSCDTPGALQRSGSSGSFAFCRISVTNSGTAAPTGQIIVSDAARLLSNDQPLELSTTTTGDPEWQCQQSTDTALRCEIPGSALTPGTTKFFNVIVAIGPQKGKMENCATGALVQPGNETGENIGKACAQAGIDYVPPILELEKTCAIVGEGQTQRSFGPAGFQARCTISVTNSGTTAATGRITIGDAGRLVNSGVSVPIREFTPDGPEWQCDQPSPSILNCQIPGPLLTPGTTRSFEVFVIVDRREGGLENCATGAMLPTTGGEGVPIEKVCTQIDAPTPNPRPAQCGSNLVLNESGKCVCPEGTKYRNGKCSGSSTTIPVPPITIPVPPTSPKLCRLLPGQVRTAANRCVCRKGTVLNKRRTACVRPPREQCQLLPGQVRTKAGQCVCRKGRVMNQSRTACVRPPREQCTLLPGQVRTSANNCVCRKGTVLNKRRTACVTPPPRQCKVRGQVRTQSGQCVCRKGTVLNSRRNACVRPPTRQCRIKGQVKTQSGQCVCRKGTVLNKRRSACITPPPRQCSAAGQVRNKVGQCVCRRGRVLNRSRTACVRREVSKPCPRGTIGKFQPNCRKIVRKRCPRGTVGRFQPNCKKVVRQRCPRGTVGTFQPNCRRVIRQRCPRGTVGTFQPNCKRVIRRKCPRGFVGTRPNCRRIQPSRPVIKRNNPTRQLN